MAQHDQNPGIERFGNPETAGRGYRNVVAGFWRQPALRRALPALAAGSALLVAASAWWAFQSPPQRTLFGELADGDKAAIVEALNSGNIGHRIDRDTGAITVADDDFHRARMLLAGQGLPKGAPSSASMMSALPLGSSRAVEDETLRGAREADLARTIEAIESIKSARVHLASPEASPFVRDSVPPAASVMLTMRSGRALSDVQIRGIRYLVAASVPLMTPERVAIVDQGGTLLSQSSEPGADIFEMQVQIEERYRQSLIALLTPLVGTGNFTTEVRVDVDRSESQSTRESYPKDDRALVSEQSNRSGGGAAGAPAIGIPGALSNLPPEGVRLDGQNAPTPPQPGTAGANSSQESVSRNFDVGREISVTHQGLGQIRRLSVAVAIRKAPSGKSSGKADLAALEQMVKGAVGYDERRGDLIAISSRPFADEPEVPQAFWEQAWFLPAVRQAGALLVAILVLVFVGRPLVRAVKTRIETVPPPSENVGAAEIPANAVAVTVDMIESAPSYSTRADLIRDYVRQDPKRAASVVRALVKERADG